MKMFKQALIIFFKEMKCIIRDAKTFFIGILIPLLLVPTLLFIVNFSMGGITQNLVKNVNIAVSDKNNSFYKFISAQDDVTVIETKNPEKALDLGKISSYIVIDENLDEKIINKEEFVLDIKYNKSSMDSIMVQNIVSGYEDTYKYILEKHSFKNVSQLEELSKMKINLSEQIEIPEMNFSSMMFTMLVPMMLIIYCCVGSSSTAAELGAGEKERGTFEPLLSTGVERSAVVLGKLLATNFMGVLSGIFTVIGLFAYLMISSGEGALKNLSMLSFVMLLVTIVILSVLFAAINLTISVYAKSYKEAQTYLTPIILIAIFPSFFTLMMDTGSINFTYLCIPILNISCIIKEILSGSVNLVHVGVVTAWHMVYIIVLCFVMFKMFKKENIIFRV